MPWLHRCQAEGVGFEPTGTCIPRLFKSLAFGRSAIPPPIRLPAHPVPEAADPRIRRPPPLLGAASDGRAVLARGRIRAEELQLGERRVQIAQTLSDDL